MLYSILLLLFFVLNCLSYYFYNLHYIYCLAYIVAYIPYTFNIRGKIIENNLIIAFPSIEKKKINYVKFHSWKFFIINLVICINQYIFGNSFLDKYYDKKIIIPKKSLMALGHHGIYYDFTSFYTITKKSLCGIYKGHFEWKINNKYINYIHHKKLNINIINRYSVLASPIDQKSSGIKLDFLNKNVTFNNFLVQYAISDSREIYFYNVVFNNFKLKVNLIQINIKDKPMEEITRELAKNIENTIRKHPEQYLWAHNRFKLK